MTRQKSTGEPIPKIDDFVNNDSKKISWTVNVKRDLYKGKSIELNDGQFVQVLYRPFSKQWSFYSRRFNERVNQMPQIFPNAELPNRVIAVTGNGSKKGLSVIMTDQLTDLNLLEAGAQCFPLWLYDKTDSEEADLFSKREVQNSWTRREAITDYALDYFSSTYPNEEVSREDIFYYIYGLLHSEEYRHRFSANLTRELPRIPCVKSAQDYRRFRDAGKALGELHVNYESVEPYPAETTTSDQAFRGASEQTYKVNKMKHPGSGVNKDISTVIYNPHITIHEIPKDAWDYVVSGKSALSWVMERQCVKTDKKKSEIVSDANRYAIETMEDSSYPLNLFLRVITVSLETIKIVRFLPELRLN